MAAGVLVLDSTYRPVGWDTLEDAVEKIVKRKAFPFAGATVIATYRSPSLTVEVPSILVLKVYVPIPKNLSRVITNTLLFARDGWTCQYCGRHKSELNGVMERVPGKSHKSGKNKKLRTVRRGEFLTKDHIKPKSSFKDPREADTWENVTTACSTCNNKKDNLLPYQSGMYPLTTPKRPLGVLITVIDRLDPEQRAFVESYSRS